MKLWLITADTRGYDVYDSAVVVAETKKIAQTIHPDNHNERDGYLPRNKDFYYSWVDKPEEVTADYIGTAKRGTKRGVICASFIAG